VNPRSLGQPRTGKPEGCYALWHDNHFELKQYAYPHRDTIKKVEQLAGFAGS